MTSPDSLHIFQEQFGKAISTPFQWTNNKAVLQLEEYNAELVADVIPLKGIFTQNQRLGLYNEQYWFRLLSIMQEELPLTCSILGFYKFNQLASAYLDKFPSASPNLNDLLQFIPQFMGLQHSWNKAMLQESIYLDVLYQKLFFKCNTEIWTPWALTEENLQVLLEQPIRFSPSVCFFQEKWNLVESRAQVTYSEDDISSSPKKQTSYWAIFKVFGQTKREKLSAFSWKLLQLMKKGLPLQQALEECQNTFSEKEVMQAASEMQNWFKNWSEWQWFCEPKK